MRRDFEYELEDEYELEEFLAQAGGLTRRARRWALSSAEQFIGNFNGYDVIDARIDVGAQKAFLRMKADPFARIDAAEMLAAVKAGQLAGIYGDDLRAAAQLAARLNTVRWELVPRGEDAALILELANPLVAPPTIIFREQARQVPQRLDPALRKAWATYRLLRNGQVRACPRGDVSAADSAFIQPLGNITPPIFCQVLGKPPTRQPPTKKPPTRRPPAQAVLTIQLSQPQAKDLFFIEPGNFPATGPMMPTIPVSGQVLSNGTPISNAQITWHFEISGTYPVRRRGAEPFRYNIGNFTTATGQSGMVDLGLLSPLIVGGTLKVTAAFQDASGRKATKQVLCSIAGKNPPPAQVAAMIDATASASAPCGDDSWILRRIFCHESLHGYLQFTSKGVPLIGPPAGVGICQRDPDLSEWRFPKNPVARLTQPNNFFPRIYWNWQENVREGIQSFRAKLREANRHLRNLQRRAARQKLTLPDPCVGVLVREAVRRFNGGTEYTFQKVRGRQSAVYLVSPRTSNPGYVNQVLGDHGHARRGTRARLITFPPIPPAFSDVTAQSSPTPGQPPCIVCSL